MSTITKGSVDEFKTAHRSMTQRVILFVTCLAVLLAQAGITLYLPALPRITEELRADGTFAGMTLGAFLLGMGAPMLLWGRLCAVRKAGYFLHYACYKGLGPVESLSAHGACYESVFMAISLPRHSVPYPSALSCLWG